jgi:hypothetical protein
LAKNLQFNFSNKLVRLKLGQNCQNMYPIRQMPFGIKGVESCERKKSPANVDEIDPLKMQ